VRGSAALATRALTADAPAAEALAPGEMRRVAYAGELLGAVRVRAAFAALPLEAFDRAAPVLEAEEQAAYLQLLRLSVGEGRNWCRAPKRDLQARLRLSERRLLRVLDALVAKRFLRPLHRDNRGTLWRVYLPAEAFGEPLGDDVLVGRAAALELVRGGGPDPGARGAAAMRTAAATPGPSARAEPLDGARHGAASAGDRAGGNGTRRTRVGPRPVHDPASLARDLAAARGRTDPDAVAAAAREIGELLAEGQRPERIAAAVEAVRRRAARAAAAPAEESP
jgi:hypothetical protein